MMKVKSLGLYSLVYLALNYAEKIKAEAPAPQQTPVHRIVAEIGNPSAPSASTTGVKSLLLCHPVAPDNSWPPPHHQAIYRRHLSRDDLAKGHHTTLPGVEGARATHLQATPQFAGRVSGLSQGISRSCDYGANR
ncbi:hypothetical protein BJV78DRAFT_1175706 [Lactifluus subvellereus]|nr:hypothetical protein BJV78DRAFT_1175706 [Lactifluus subvellereus]